jgi:hypothetical protein
MLLYVGLGLIGALPLFLLVASARCQSLGTARRGTMKFLEEWGGIAPKSLREWVRTAIGSSVSFAFLVALAFTFNLLGDAVMPAFSRPFGYFGSHHVAWSEEHRFDWETFRETMKSQWVLGHPGEDLRQPAAFEKFKNDRGKELVRVPRTLVIFSLLLIPAGLLDLRSKRFRRRGLALLSIGCLSFFLFSIIWTNRKAHYIREVMTANETLGHAKVALPLSWSSLSRPPRRASDG